eukprot:1089540-Pyramimonas_sp.AAC.1
MVGDLIGVSVRMLIDFAMSLANCWYVEFRASKRASMSDPWATTWSRKPRAASALPQDGAKLVGP